MAEAGAGGQGHDQLDRDEPFYAHAVKGSEIRAPTGASTRPLADRSLGSWLVLVDNSRHGLNRARVLDLLLQPCTNAPNI